MKLTLVKRSVSETKAEIGTEFLGLFNRKRNKGSYNTEHIVHHIMAISCLEPVTLFFWNKSISHLPLVSDSSCSLVIHKKIHSFVLMKYLT